MAQCFRWTCSSYKEVGMPTWWNQSCACTFRLLISRWANPPQNLPLGCMAFMDSYNFDVNRVRRCVVHYITPDLKIIPFCAYNNVHRVAIEKAYAARQKKAWPFQNHSQN
jgi:hypothetical protein